MSDMEKADWTEKTNRMLDPFEVVLSKQWSGLDSWRPS